MKEHAVLGSLGAVAAAVATVVVQNGGMLVGMLSVAQSTVAPNVAGIDGSDITPVLVGVALLWLAYGLYRLTKKIAERVS